LFRNRERTIRDQRILGEGDAELFAEGRAPCVVAFHGFGGTAAEIRPLLAAIAAAGYAVDAALLPGHGTRAEELQDSSYEVWLDAARRRALAAADKHGRVVLLGFSLGSLVAMEIASEHPSWLVGLVALGNALTLRLHSAVPLGVWTRLGWKMPDVYLLKPRAGDLVDPAAMGTLVTYDRHPLRAALHVFQAGTRVRALVPRIECPTLVLHGRRDLVCSWKNATWLAEHIGTRDVSVRIFEKSAHVVACDGEREEVAREVVTWLGRVC
jgi:carboxylesterase